MSTRIGRSLASVVAICFVAAAGLAVMKGMNQPRTLPKLNPREELITFVVTFEPPARTKLINIARAPGPGDIAPVKVSPWVDERMLPPGTPVQVVAKQQEGGRLACKIRKGFKMIVPEQKRETKGAVICTGTT